MYASIPPAPAICGRATPLDLQRLLVLSFFLCAVSSERDKRHGAEVLLRQHNKIKGLLEKLGLRIITLKPRLLK
jgi:hypothetical protein